MNNKIIKYLKRKKDGDTLNNIAKNVKEDKPSIKGYLTFLICKNIITKEQKNNNIYYKLNN